MQHRYQEHNGTQLEDRPRDQYGRFESEHEGRSRYGNRADSRENDYPGDDQRGSRGYQSDNRPRDEYGRFESTGSGRYSGSSYRGSSFQYDRPRDEYGRFESTGWDREPGPSQEGSSSQYDRPRDEYGRFESTGRRQYSGPSYSPRHEYGRFESRSSDRDYQNAQSQRGQHAGKGPKGYQRSDERIQEDVSENLAQDSELDASEIEVKVHNGVVILTGTVSERQFKRMAEDLAERCYGVKDVRNEIRMGRDSETNAEKSRSTAKSA